MSAVVGSGKYTYEVDQQWAQLPEGVEMRAAAVAVDSQDRVYCFNRSEEHPVMVFAADGSYLRSWGAGQFEFPHAIYIDATRLRLAGGPQLRPNHEIHHRRRVATDHRQ